MNLTPYQITALTSKYEHTAMFAGVGVGKTYTGSHYAIGLIESRPDLTGFIGANTYDQLSQATMRELMYWLDDYKYDYVVDQIPPYSWGARREFKTYKNTICVRPKSKPRNHHVTMFTRVLSKPNPVRGIEFSWYWLDESRDTPRETHDVVLSRMRESRTFRRGLVTTTTNGEDWAWERFVRNNRKGQRMYGAMHIETYEAVKAGVLSPSYYNLLCQSYSPLMAEQELFAKHVNVRGGRAYYAAGTFNRLSRAPWGDLYPDQSRPLIVGCDFNYSPAPCVWMVGQLGPNQPDNYGGLWSDHIHWYGEISRNESSSPEMAQELANRYPGFFYRIFGDSYGKMGTTSNAGQNDYSQIGHKLQDNGCQFTIDVEQSNPHVKDRVENMNRLFRNSIGETYQTYDQNLCPLFDSDVKNVGWKQSMQKGRGKLDNGGDVKRTHATDGGGYAVWKLFPPVNRAVVTEGIPSYFANDFRSVL